MAAYKHAWVRRKGVCVRVAARCTQGCTTRVEVQTMPHTYRREVHRLLEHDVGDVVGQRLDVLGEGRAALLLQGGCVQGWEKGGVSEWRNEGHVILCCARSSETTGTQKSLLTTTAPGARSLPLM
jgi:hypothetical protein